MANKIYKRFLQGIGLIPKSANENAKLGDLEVKSTDNRLYFFGASNDKVTTDVVVTTLTNKTINGPDNTITNLVNANLSGSAAISNANLAAMPTLTILGNDSGGSAVPQYLTPAEVNTMLETTNAITSIGDLDSQAANAQGLTRVGHVLSTQSASATEPGMVNNTIQTLSGQKTFSTGITVSNLDLTQAVDSSTTGANADVSAPTVGTIIFTNASLASIRNIGAGVTGRVLVIKNSTGATITIINDSGGTAANRIVTGTGGNLSLLNTACLFLVYDGNATRWTVIGGSGGGSGNLVVDTFTGDGSDVTFTLSVDPLSENNTWVYLSGVYQDKSTYSVSGTTLTFSTAPPNGVSIEVVIGQTTSIGVPADGTVTVVKLDSGAAVVGSCLEADGAGGASYVPFVGMRAFGSTTTITGSAALVVFDTVSFDTHSAYSAGVFTVPIDGKYQVNTKIATSGSASGSTQLQIYKNASEYSTMLFTNPLAGGFNLPCSGSDIVSCVAGDTISIFAFSSTTSPSILNGTPSWNTFSVCRVGE